MNISSSDVRKKLEYFDEKGFFKQKISASALLKDTGYSVHDEGDIIRMVDLTRNTMARISEVELAGLHNIHSGRNGRNDCDNFSFVGAYILKLIHDRECRADHERGNEFEYAIFPIARKDQDHTQCIALSYEMQWCLIDFIDGSFSKITEKNKPQIMMVM